MEGTDLEPLQVAKQLLVLLQSEPHFRSDLSFTGRPSKPRRKRADGLFHCPALAPKLPWAPVECAQAVENRAPNPELRIAPELNFLGRVKLRKRIHQTHNTCRNEVFNVYVLRQSVVNAPGQKAHHRQMLQQ